VVLIAAVAAAVAWVHAPVLSVRAVWFDDSQYVIKNPLVLQPSWQSARRFVTEVRRPSTIEGYYQPLAMLSLMLDSAAGGAPDHLRPFHRTSLALHVLNTVLVIVLLIMLFGEPYAALLAGLLFGLHPLTVEPVAWMSERKTLLAACFALCALIAYVRWARLRAGAAAAPWRRPLFWYAACLIGYGLALLSKPTSTPLPVLFVLLDYWPLQRLSWRVLLEKVPFVLLGLIAALGTVVSQANAANIVYPSEQSPLRLLLILCHNVVFYLGKTAWPVHLAGHYPLPEPLGLAQPGVLAGVVGTVVLLVLLAVSWRWTRALLTGWLFFFVAILPTMGVVGFTIVIASDKYVYLPSLGLLMIVTWLLARWWSPARGAPRPAVRAAICIAVLALAAAEARTTRRYLAVWQDTETLNRYVLGQYRAAWMVHYNFAVFLTDEGREPEAARHYLEVLALKPDAVARNLANALLLLGRTDEAVAHYRKVIDNEPGDVAATYNLAVALTALGRTDEAVATLRRVLRLDPDNVSANKDLARALVAQGHPEQAIAYYRKAVERQPDLVEVQVELADTLQVIGRPDEAIAQYGRALQLDPNDAAVHNNLAVALAERGRLDEAIAHYREALRLDPALDSVRVNLNAVLAERARQPGSR
jgi:tetratricopeptide (TPR) repeat protein